MFLTTWRRARGGPFGLTQVRRGESKTSDYHADSARRLRSAIAYAAINLSHVGLEGARSTGPDD